MNIRTWTAVGVVAAGVGLAGTASRRTDKLRLQAAVPSASIYFELLNRYAERIEKMSDGRVEIEVLPDGAIVPAFEILDAVDQGVVEAGYAWTHYWSGKHPAAGLFSNPMAGAGAGLDQLVARRLAARGRRRRALRAVLQRGAEGQRAAASWCSRWGRTRSAGSQRPIESVDDFKKLKYRSPPGITGEIFAEMGDQRRGAAGRRDRAGGAARRHRRGRVDRPGRRPATSGCNTVWKNYYLQGLHQSTDVGEVIINKDVWDGLPPDIQEIFRTAALASMAETYAFNVARNAAAIVEAARGVRRRDPGHAARTSSPSSCAPPTSCSTATRRKDAFFKEVLDSQRTFAETVVPYWTKILDLYSQLGNAALGSRSSREAAAWRPHASPAALLRVTGLPSTRISLWSGRIVAWLIFPMVLGLDLRGGGPLPVQCADRLGLRHDLHALRHVLHAGLGLHADAEGAYPHRHLLRRLVAARAGHGGRRVLRRSSSRRWSCSSGSAGTISRAPSAQGERMVTSPWMPIVYPFKFVIPLTARAAAAAGRGGVPARASGRRARASGWLPT